MDDCRLILKVVRDVGHLTVRTVCMQTRATKGQGRYRGASAVASQTYDYQRRLRTTLLRKEDIQDRRVPKRRSLSQQSDACHSQSAAATSEAASLALTNVQFGPNALQSVRLRAHILTCNGHAYLYDTSARAKAPKTNGFR